MTEFTPIASAIGGLLIGSSAIILLLSLGRIAGISGILDGAIFCPPQERGWRRAFIAGLFCGGVLLALAVPQSFSYGVVRSPAALIVAGLLVGFGSRLGGGCTSGHGVCGLGRLSKRSLMATLTFMGTAATTVFVVRTLAGASI